MCYTVFISSGRRQHGWVERKRRKRKSRYSTTTNTAMVTTIFSMKRKKCPPTPLERIRESYREESDVNRDYKTDDETIDTPLENLLLDGVALELKLKPEEVEALEESEGRRLLKRELREEALRRYEESARTVQDFKNVHATWDKLDTNRERKERYHELLRGDVPIDYDVDYGVQPLFPAGGMILWSGRCCAATFWITSLTVPMRCTI